LYLRLFWYIFITLYVFLPIYYLITKKYFNRYSFIDRILATFVLVVSQITVTEIVLGLFMELSAINLTLLNIVLSTSIFIFTGVSRKDIIAQLEEIKFNFAQLFRTLLRNRILFLIFILFIIQILWWGFLVYLFPPYAWDSLTYHLPKVGYILQSGGIEVFKVGWSFINGYPFNSELIFLWNTIFLQNDILVDGSQIVFAIFAVLAVYSLARKAGVKFENALFALIFLFVPILIQQATTSYIDIIISSMVIITVNFMLLRAEPKINLLILGFSVGFVIGSKYSFVIPELVISLVLLLLVIRDYLRKTQARKYSSSALTKILLRDFGLYISPILLIGGIWYIRNILLFSNPIAPIEVSFFSHTFFSGDQFLSFISKNTPVFTDPNAIINSWFERSAPYWDHPGYNYDVGRGGFGPMFVILLVPSILFSIYLALRRGNKIYLLITIIFALVFFTVSMNWLSRYTLFLCGFGAIAFILVIEYFPRSKMITLIALPVILLNLVLGNVNNYFTPTKILDFVNRPLNERRCSDFPVLFEKYTGIFQSLNTSEGTTILYTDIPSKFVYPLWNSNFSNFVFCIPERYPNYEAFVYQMRGYGESQIITNENSGILEYYKAHGSDFQVVYQYETWWVLSYKGDGNVQK
jgi:hypothetical protein